jgi:hypothetical protein
MKQVCLHFIIRLSKDCLKDRQTMEEASYANPEETTINQESRQ